MSVKYIIMSLVAPIKYMTAEYQLVDDNSQAVGYDVLADAHKALSELFIRASIWPDEQANYSVTPIFPAEFKTPKTKLPPPDFFEVMQVELTAETVLELLSSDTFELCFTGVSAITGSGQMVVNLLINPITRVPTGREFKFSFVGTMNKTELETLKEMAEGNWSNCIVQSHGNGPAAWTTVTLLAELA